MQEEEEYAAKVEEKVAVSTVVCPKEIPLPSLLLNLIPSKNHTMAGKGGDPAIGTILGTHNKDWGTGVPLILWASFENLTLGLSNFIISAPHHENLFSEA